MTKFQKLTIEKNYNLYTKGVITGLVIAGLFLTYFALISGLGY